MKQSPLFPNAPNVQPAIQERPDEEVSPVRRPATDALVWRITGVCGDPAKDLAIGADFPARTFRCRKSQDASIWGPRQCPWPHPSRNELSRIGSIGIDRVHTVGLGKVNVPAVRMPYRFVSRDVSN